MSYDYIRRTYPVNPKVGIRVRHNETNRMGFITREDRSQSHYVQVRFDGDGHSLPCHPTALDYPIRNYHSENAVFRETNSVPDHQLADASPASGHSPQILA